MASGSNKNPIPVVEQLPMILQPVNVQLNELAKQLTALIQVTQKASTGTAQATASLQQSQSTLMALLGQVKTGVSAAMATAANSVTQLVGTVQSTMGQFVSAFRPDVMERFQIVVNDLMAVIGEVMVPIMQVATQMFRWLADTLAGVAQVVLPMVRTAIEALKPILEAVGSTLRGALNFEVIEAQFKQFMAIIDALKEPILTLLPIFLQVVQVIQSINVAIVGVMTGIVKSLAPIVSALAAIVAPLIQMILMPFQVLASVIGPIIQIALLPLTIGFQILALSLKPLGIVLSAVTGVMQPFIKVIDMIGQTFGDVFGMLTGLFQDAFQIVGELLQPLRTFFDDTLNYVVDQLKFLADKIKEWINDIRDFFGLELLGGNKGIDAKDSKGKGATQAAFTSTDELWKKLVASTFGAGRGMAEEYPKTTAAATTSIWKWIEGKKETIEAGFEAMSILADNLGVFGNVAAKTGGMIGGPAMEMMIKSLWRGNELRGG